MPEFLFKKMETPTPFGSFHLVFFISFILIAILLIHFFRKCNDRTFKVIIGIAWLIIVLFEVSKQIVWNYDYSRQVWKSNYDWSAFPFQLCSLPFYLWPVLFFMKRSKYCDALCLFLATFVFFGGLGYFFFPVSFCEYLTINIQTMVHHGTQASICLFIFIHEYDRFTYKKFAQSSIFLVFSVAMAIVLNIIFSNFGTINLFELNPLQPTQAFLFSDILKATNYPTFLLIYIAGFFIFANATYFAVKGFVVFNRHIASKKELNSKTA